MDYSDRLKTAMDLASVTRQDLAKGLGISVAAVGLVLNRNTKMFDAVNHLRAAAYCKVNAYWLATGEGAMLEPAESLPTSMTIEQSLSTLAAALAADMPDDTREDVASALAKLAIRKGNVASQSQVLFFLQNRPGSAPANP